MRGKKAWKLHSHNGIGIYRDTTRLQVVICQGLPTSKQNYEMVYMLLKQLSWTFRAYYLNCCLVGHLLEKLLAEKDRTTLVFVVINTYNLRCLILSHLLCTIDIYVDSSSSHIYAKWTCSATSRNLQS